MGVGPQGLAHPPLLSQSHKQRARMEGRGQDIWAANATGRSISLLSHRGGPNGRVFDE